MDKQKIFFNGGLNADDDFEIVGSGEWVNAQNMRYGTTEKGAVGRFERIFGTSEIPNPYLPIGTNITRGGCEDKGRFRGIYFNYNSTGDHAIYCVENDSIYKVLTNDQVEGGLGITETGFIHSAAVIDGNLLFIDSNEVPRFVVIDAGIKLNHPGYDTDVEAYPSLIDIALIKKPPIYRLTVAKAEDSGFDNNYIDQQAYTFRYQYVFKDNQNSVLSAHSEPVPFNTEAETYNCIDVNVEFSEVINDHVQEVIVWAKNLITEKVYEVKRWNKNTAADLTAIDDHNSGTTKLSFRFYDNVAPIFLDDVRANTSEDFVPIKSKTLDVAKGRCFTGNNLSGYDTPAETSLTAEFVEADPSLTSVTAHWYQFDLTRQAGEPGEYQETAYYLYITGITTPGIYRYSGASDPRPFPATVAFSTLDYGGNDLYHVGFYGSDTVVNTATELTDTSSVTGVTMAGDIFMKANGIYQPAIFFLDKYKRSCGVKAISPLTNADRTYTDLNYNSLIHWTLDNTNALTEIPTWAHYYQVAVTKNLLTRNFVQARSEGMFYVIKDDATKEYDYSVTTWPGGRAYAVAVNIKQLTVYGLGYVFSEGDMIRVYLATGGILHEKIFAVDGDYVMFKPSDLGTLSSSTVCLYEIYTPYKASSKEPFYEVGDVMKINDPETDNREYSLLSGYITGDIYSLERYHVGTSTSYNTENMSRSDKQWSKWISREGWPRFTDTIGQQRIEQEIRPSDVYLAGTKTNNLNIFQPLNVVNVDTDGGAINRLKLADRGQNDGSVMLIISEYQTFSAYLGKSEIFDNAGSAFVAKGTNIIGTINALSGASGTINPESVIEINGLVKWFDRRNRRFVQYSNNGVDVLSNKKFNRPANLLGKDLETGDLVIGGVDPYHMEDYWSIPQTHAEPPKGFLSDYDNEIYPYDIYDGQAKSIIYKAPFDRWMGSFSMPAETFIRVAGDMYSCYGGVLYKHNQDTDTIYGQPYTSRVMYVVNQNPDKMKMFLSKAFNAGGKPSFVHFRTEDPFIQSSDLLESDFAVKEGEFCAAILRNRLDPNVTGTPLQRQMRGERMIGKYLLCMAETSTYLKFVTTSFNYQEGHIT